MSLAEELLALVAAAEAAARDEVPVGAVVRDGRGFFLAESANGNRREQDPSAHAEISALRLAGRRCGNFRLVGATLTVSLQPCPMCLAAGGVARLAAIQYSANRQEGLDAVRTPPPPLRRLEEFSQEAGEVLRFFFEPRRQA